jgi:hypothetical protein
VSDQFEPRLVQAEYLRQAGFRDHLVFLVATASGLWGSNYIFSKENESERVDASIALSDILGVIGVISPTTTIAGQWTPLVNLFIERYELGDPITDEELGLPELRRPVQL